MELKVLERDGNKLKIEILDTATEFLDDTIIWLNNPNAIPSLIENRSKLPFINTGRSWVIPTEDYSPTSDQIELLLNE